MTFFEAIILSVIQSATEFLPVSSSGHLLFMKGIFHLEEIPIIFDVVIHVGSLTAILIFYHHRILNVVSETVMEWRNRAAKKPQTRFLIYIIISTFVTMGIYLLFNDTIEAQYETPAVLFYTFLFTSVLLFSTLFISPNTGKPVTQKGILLPLFAGFFQALAILPGVSRSGSTISTLLHFNIKKQDAAFYSFFLAIPAILGALAFKLTDLESISYLLNHWPLILISFVLSAIFSYFFLFLLNWILSKGKLWYFSFYTLLMAIISKILF